MDQWPCYFQNRILMSVSQSRIYEPFPGLVCLFCCSQIDRPITGIHKLLTDTWMQDLELGTRPYSFISGNTLIGFSVQCMFQTYTKLIAILGKHTTRVRGFSVIGCRIKEADFKNIDRNTGTYTDYVRVRYWISLSLSHSTFQDQPAQDVFPAHLRQKPAQNPLEGT